jgi:hypothetical protein
MKAVPYGQAVVDRRAQSEARTGEMKRCAERIWNAISKYVTFDDDAIFKDPNWPHMWDKKR